MSTEPLDSVEAPLHQAGHCQCGFCGSASGDALYRTRDIYGSDYTVCACRDCGAHFLAPRPDDAALRRAYGNEYYGEKESKFNSSAMERLLDFSRLLRARRVSRYLKDGDRVLDIGCGNGRFLKFLLRYGHYELFGTELEGPSARRAATIREIHLDVGDLREELYPRESFSAITMFHVFEHLREPRRVLEIATRLLKPGGVMVLSFPNVDGFQSLVFKGNWFHLDPPRHLFFFRPPDLVERMKDYGFTLVRKSFFSPEQNPYGMAQSVLNCLCDRREVLYERLKGNRLYGPEYSGVRIFLFKAFCAVGLPAFVLLDAIESLLRKAATVELVFRRFR
jgi:SAM-dependent methyltransferase